MTSHIPIENVYYLFCYAWKRFREGRAIGVGTTVSPQIWDLFASVLVRGMTRLLRRGLDRGYIEVQEDIPSIRGRVLLQETLRRNLIVKGQANCQFDELEPDVLHNRIIKATLSLLARSQDINNTLRHESGMLVRKLPEISNIELSKFVFRSVQLSRNNGHYDLMLKICELLHSALLPTKRGEGSKFADILQQQERMSAVFEEFVRNFFIMEQTRFESVGTEIITWNADALRSSDVVYLPVMRTDVTLRSRKRVMIIDTKYYTQTLTAHFAGEKVWAEHLYQLYAYLRNARRKDHTTIVEGVLLYPTVEQALDLRYVIDGHPVRVITLDLRQHWTKIHDQLLGMIEGDTEFRH